MPAYEIQFRKKKKESPTLFSLKIFTLLHLHINGDAIILDVDIDLIRVIDKLSFHFMEYKMAQQDLLCAQL